MWHTKLTPLGTAGAGLCCHFDSEVDLLLTSAGRDLRASPAIAGSTDPPRWRRVRKHDLRLQNQTM
eukprot:1190876-Rhodomonas_salina.1